MAASDATMLHQISLHQLPDCCTRCNATNRLPRRFRSSARCRACGAGRLAIDPLGPFGRLEHCSLPVPMPAAASTWSPTCSDTPRCPPRRCIPIPTRGGYAPRWTRCPARGSRPGWPGDRRDGSGDARDDRPPGDDRVTGPARRPERLARVRRHRCPRCPRRTGRPAGRAGRPTVPGRVRLGSGRSGSGPVAGSSAARVDATGRPGPGGDKRDELCGAGLLTTAGLTRAVPSAPVAPDAARSIGGRVRR